MKKLLILGGASVHVKLVEAAKEMGLYTIVTDYLIDSPAKKIADKSYMYDINDIDGIVEMCKKEKVDGVLGPYLDPCQRPYFLICHRLGLPCYIDTWEQVFTLTDKEQFKAICMQNGIDVIPTYDIEQPEEINYPVLVKPAISRGSRGQKICNTFQEVVDAYERAKAISNNGKAIIEKFMSGYSDFSMVYLLVDGKAYLTKTADRYLGEKSAGLGRIAAGGLSPSRYTDMYRTYVEKHFLDMLKKLGIKNGPVFAQGFVDGNTVRFYDPGFRAPGSDYDEIFKAVWNVDISKLLIEFALNGKMNDSSFPFETRTELLNGKVGLTLLPMLRPGKITEIRGISQVESIPNIVKYSIRHCEGDEILATGDVNQRFAEFNLKAESLEDLESACLKLFSILQVKDEYGNEMLYGKTILKIT